MFEPEVKDIKKLIKLTGKSHKWCYKLLDKGYYRGASLEWIADLINQAKIHNQDSTAELVNGFYMSLNYVETTIPKYSTYKTNEEKRLGQIQWLINITADASMKVILDNEDNILLFIADENKLIARNIIGLCTCKIGINFNL